MLLVTIDNLHLLIADHQFFPIQPFDRQHFLKYNWHPSITRDTEFVERRRVDVSYTQQTAVRKCIANIDNASINFEFLLIVRQQPIVFVDQ